MSVDITAIVYKVKTIFCMVIKKKDVRYNERAFNIGVMLLNKIRGESNC